MTTERRNSKKRQAIYDALCCTKAHPSAEQLYARLKPKIPDLSLGTVYRNLGVLLEDGLIISVGNVNGEERYDANTTCHPHFICTECGAVYDIELFLNLDYNYADIEKHLGAKVEGYSISFSGKCKDCCEIRH